MLVLVLVLVLVLEAWVEDIDNATCRQIVIDAPLQAGAWNAFLGTPRTYAGLSLRLRHQALVRPCQGTRMPA
ncbi:hypothetical protein FHT12_003937 [Xanthomonas campestris]|uniref:hypothetical protein n=1 Tax=Xanthomonas euroxanthea TaxID=2259622 RepID=UPI000CEF120B|nr:hypothetical protein [Xanthomonas euroxanthea]NIJ95196.1 hypothetical protein [Xanthomonas euroxanthea]PPT32208.1 hypothetical protein XaCFBP7622_06605 [Xanthomonas arboricola]